MPELPEVETIRRQLAERLPGRTISRAAVADPLLVSPEDPVAFAAQVEGRRVEAVDRRGKYLLVELDSGDTLAMHLRMTGRLHWRPPSGDGGEERFLRARLHLDDGSTVTFGDMRRFGRAWIVPATIADREGYWAGRVGIEPLSPRFTGRVLAALLEGRRGPVKAVLLNQALVAGLGNMYVERGALPGAHPPRAAGGDARRRRDPPAAPGDPRPAGGGRRGRRRLHRQLPRRARAARLDAGSPARPPARGRPLPALPHGDLQDARGPAGHLLVPRLPAGARAVVSEIAGVRVGHSTDAAAGTGCTVVLPPPGTVGGVEVRGGGPATRDTDLLAPLASVQDVTALALSGGSAFGLDVAAGVARWCEEAGLGHDTGAALVPVVPAACIYDLGVAAAGSRPGPEGIRRVPGRRCGAPCGGERRRGHRRRRGQAARPGELVQGRAGRGRPPPLRRHRRLAALAVARRLGRRARGGRRGAGGRLRPPGGVPGRDRPRHRVPAGAPAAGGAREHARSPAS